MENNDYLLLKWGTLNGFDFTNSPEALEAYREYNAIGESFSAMQQVDTPRQKELICIMIDTVNGRVSSDWSGEDWTDKKEVAKAYILNYGKNTE